MKFAKDEKGNLHVHASSFFRPLQFRDYWQGFLDIVLAFLFRARTLNFHLPYESQFKSYYHPKAGWQYINFINFWSRIFGMKTVWENTNILNPKDWSLIENPSHIPKNLSLCFDLGHFILGSKSKTQALAKVDRFFKEHGRDIKHLHLHVNDLKRDKHYRSQRQVKAFLGQNRFQKLTKNRTYIFEKG
ncbi:hypothetical protein A2313_01020 [Candidatus Roizmanbacteria bacterium RIFOXYB2_FULL_41_10]|uniref:Xylose isomerase-like TIM barrel domain-containing protein n=1 Tax=Candidatus Roizmanbacteria bacterium RIFOXYA1_FULL_41_12 TaxID=1802082 RepID=A0A1F7KFD2_9BACT|nr:MAG: hypothetical protein A2209_01070 [Candidatus Roizmanbacteria bacterium RIFOXYA1_FULL_41_12]OGK67273.1 MAG: hypothetical protein A2377_01110 [Candidatus Roizmanbacteria bacterium RIFOXYB1_FULL_41_27]OGK67808.1 MAG: hypothetical protein A2262_03890 [Candidatus Roizmanbacteria bacterium RIFOXYA2_FULL_41_8]OGK69345.1 MAG: hypothetical protein A2313_01020 [Candidatus Roizmanbacteria bacterium RIFOXYB2_FULL_41_10]OGK71135.1 MAG: hypothetical protein A2403_02890 [Candidatus Roizmanbacteria bac